MKLSHYFYTMKTYACNHDTHLTPAINLTIICLVFLLLLSPWSQQGTSQCQTGVRTLRSCFRMRKVNKTPDYDGVSVWVVSNPALKILHIFFCFCNNNIKKISRLLFFLWLFFSVALDWGGPRREWFELICKTLFDTSNQLFTRFSDNNQGLVSHSVKFNHLHF